MTEKFVTDLDELNDAPADNDVVHIVDVSDKSSHGAGASKKIQIQKLLETVKEDINTKQNELVTFRSITESTTLLITDQQIECNSGAGIVVTLPTAEGVEGKVYSIKNIGEGVVSVETTGEQTIDGETDQHVFLWENMVLISNGSDWFVI